MANKICRPLFEVQDFQYARIKVPTGQTYYPGDVVLAETLDTTITDNLEVYAPTPISDITTQYPVIIINQGFEVTSDGRRISGNPDISTYSYSAGTVLNAIRLHKDMKFIISDDCLDNTGVVAVAAGVYLIPQNSDVNLATSLTTGTAVTALKIELDTNEANGGLNGLNFVDTALARVVLPV